MQQEVNTIPQAGLYALLPRLLSLLLATGMAGVILTFPKALAHVNHGMLSLAMLGICAGFVHGVGFIPQTRIGRILFGPWVAWLLMGLGVWLLLLN